MSPIPRDFTKLIKNDTMVKYFSNGVTNTSKSMLLTKFGNFSHFFGQISHLYFLTIVGEKIKKIEKKTVLLSKNWPIFFVFFFLQKLRQLKIFKNTSWCVEISADPQIGGIVTFGPKKPSETHGCIFLHILTSKHSQMRNFTQFFIKIFLYDKTFWSWGDFWRLVEISDTKKNLLR